MIVVYGDIQYFHNTEHYIYDLNLIKSNTVFYY